MKKWLLNLVVCMGIFQGWGPLAFSDSCSRIHQTLPLVQDQGATPSCYAHSASALWALVLGQDHVDRERARGLDLYDEILRSEKWVLDVNTGRTCNAFRLAQRRLGPVAQGYRCEQLGFLRAKKGWVLESPAHLIQGLHIKLENGPVGIEYCSGVLMRSGSFIVRRSFEEDLNYLATSRANLNFSSACGFHASAVVGRKRMADGRCYFQIQNSWGETCSPYPSKIRPCEKGRVWVPEDELAENLVRVVSIQ